MLCQAAIASGLGGIFTMSASGQQGTARRRVRDWRPGRPAGGGGGRGAPVHYGPINKFSSPSDLRITDIRALRVAANFDYPIIKIFTNQDVYGLGEVRDAGNENLALGMKPLLVGRNPLDISGILQSVRPYAGPGRQGGGFSAIDIALHDITGKVFGVPVWRLLGDKKRDRVRMYCDTTGTSDPKKYGDRMVERMKKGFTFFKMDVTTNFVGVKPGYLDTEGVPTDKGLEYGGELITAVRDAIGWDKPLAVDASSLRCGTVPDGIRAAKTFEKCRLSWLEDLFYTGGFWRWKDFKEIKAHTSTPLLTGEDAFGLEEGFQPLIDNRAVDIIHADHGTSGGCRETKRIADYACEPGADPDGHSHGGIAAGHHRRRSYGRHAGVVHGHGMPRGGFHLLVAATDHGSVAAADQQGYITVPDAPGLGVELNEKVVKEHLRKPGYFDPSTKWDDSIIGRGGGGPWPHFNVDGVWVNERTSDY